MRFTVRQPTLAIAIAAVSLLSVACSSATPAPTPTNSADGRLFAQIGRGEMSDQVASELFSRGADVQRVENASEVDIEPGLTLLFDAQWLSDRKDTPELQSFLASAIDENLAIVMIGGQTSQLYLELEKAKAITIADDNGMARNPAESDPPVAGVRIKHREDDRPYISSFASAGTNAGSYADGILQWQDHYSEYES